MKSDPINLCFLLQDTGHIYGAQRATLDLLAGLVEQDGCEVHVILFQELRSSLPSKDYKEAIRALGIPCLTPPVAGTYSRKLIRVIRDYATVHNIQVVHSVGYKADLHALKASQRQRRFKVVSTVHGWFFLPDWKEKLYYVINLWTLRQFSTVIVLSRFYETLCTNKGLQALRIPSGFRPPETTDSSHPIYAAGILSRFTGEKNIPIFIRAIEQLHIIDPGWRFVIAGEGPDRYLLESLVQQAGLTATVDFPGFIERDTFFSQVQIPVICSNIENLPYTVMEAMAYERPVVGTRVGGLPDLIDDEQTGLLVDKGDASGLARAIATLLADPEKAAALSKAGREKLHREFSPKQAVENHVRVYRALQNPIQDLAPYLDDYTLLDNLTEMDVPTASVVTHETWFTPGQLQIVQAPEPRSPLGDLAYAFKLLWATKPHQCLLLNQVDRAPQLAALIKFALPFTKHKIVLYDVFIDTPSRLKQLAVRWQVKGARLNVLFSRYQVQAYMRRFGMESDRFSFIPYQSSHSKRPPLDEPYGDYVFSGGNSARDYRTVCEAARGTGVPFKITSTNESLFEGVEVPKEITITPVVEPGFTQMMAGSRFVVMALTAGRDRGYGEQTILNSWWHGRAVIVADDVSASDYITDGEDGYVLQPGDVEGLRTRITELYNDPAKAESMGRKGREKVKEHYYHEIFLHRMKMISLLLAATD